MNLPETNNPFKKARIIGRDVKSAEYTTSEHKRGSKDYVMSRSELCAFMECPAKWIRGGRADKETDSTEWGSLVDCLLLTPQHFNDIYAVAPLTYPDSKTGDPKPWNWNANFCKDWRDEQNGKIVITQRDFEAAQIAVARLKEDETICEYVECSDKQVFVLAEYHDEATGLVIPFKSLLDLVPFKDHVKFGKTICDFKTSRNANPKSWNRLVYDRQYHIQGATQLDTYVAATGEDRVDFRHIVQENFAPFEYSKNLLSAEFLEIGRAEYVAALKRYARCLAENYWPGYSTNDHLDGWSFTHLEAWMVK